MYCNSSSTRSLESDHESDSGTSCPAEARSSSMSHDNSRSANPQCTSQCCNDREFPFQPRAMLHTKKRQGKQNRSFNTNWYRDHKWLSFCTSQGKVFCFYCQKAACDGLLPSGSRTDSTLITTGFDNWKKAKDKFRAHEKSQTHRDALFAHRAHKQPPVTAQLSDQVLRQQKCHRDFLMIELSSLKYLMRQGLAVRGHKEEEGNLYQLLKCRSDDVPGLSSWLRDGQYLSHEIIDELIGMMAKKVRSGILSEVHEAEWYGIIGDETRDEGGVEQFALSLRWVDSEYTVYEEIVELIDVEQTDAATLVSALRESCRKMVLSLANCRGQAYDGASNMAGHLNGVAARILKEAPKAHYVHCLAHSLNLCLQDCTSSCPIIKESLLLVTELSTLVRASPKRLALFKNLQHSQAPNIKPLCPTRWTVRTGAINSVLQNYDTLFETLDEISADTHGEPAAKALGIRALLTKFGVFFGLKFSEIVFSATEQLSVTLQNHDINAQQAISAVNAAARYFQRLRSHSSFDSFYKAVVEAAKDLTDKPALPRQKRIPRRHNQGAENYHHTTPDEYFRQQYFEVLDTLISELTRRFSQASFSFLQEAEKAIIDSCNGVHIELSEAFQEVCEGDVDVDLLATQLLLLPDVIKTANQQHNFTIKKVTSIATVCDVFNSCTFAKVMLSNVHQLLRIYLTVPMTSATAERTFSTLRRVKNYLRTTMTQDRLNNVMLLHAHKQRTDNLNLQEIATNFACRNKRRRNYFGSF